MRLIDADALAAHMFHGYDTEVTPVDIGAETYKLGWNDAIDAIMENAPTIEPDHKTGRWSVEDCHAATYKYCCSNCKAHHRARYDFCPSCGAKMEVEHEID